MLRLGQFLVADNPHAAQRAVSVIEQALRSLGHLPERSPALDEGHRELMIPFGSSGYVARYRVDPDAVVIARIFHMREDR